MSASRVTRKRNPFPVFIFGNNSCALAAITSSSSVYLPFFSLIGINRGTDGGSLIRAKRFCRNKCLRFFCVCCLLGSINRPRFRLRFDMYGNGWFEFTDLGANIGKRLSREYLSSFFLSLAVSD